MENLVYMTLSDIFSLYIIIIARIEEVNRY